MSKQDKTAYLEDIEYDTKNLTRGAYNDIKKAFAFLDKDQSQKLSKDELVKAVEDAKKEIKEEFPEFDIDEVVKTIMDQVDENGDGEIDLKEFVNIMAAPPINDITKKENCNKIYKEFTNGGKLDEERLMEIAKEMGEEPDEEHIKRMMVFADADGDGEINEEEFYNILNPPTEEYLQERAEKWVAVKTGDEEAPKKKIVKRKVVKKK